MAFLTWHTLVFILPLGIGLALLFGSAAGLADFGGDLDVDADADADADGETETSWFAAALSLLGVGRVPLSILLMTAAFTFGGVGLVVKALFAAALGPNAAAGVALGIALLATPVLTGAAAHWLARLLPSTETYASPMDALVGKTGVATLDISRDFGIAHVTDEDGTQMRIRCRTYDGAIEAGSPVLVTEYDSDQHEFTVAKSPI